VLKEVIAEKLRAAVTREMIAPRDFYDIDFVLRNGFNLTDHEALDLFKKKLEEDNAEKRCGHNLFNNNRRVWAILFRKRSCGRL
jgi:hypothetical protein